MVRIWINGQRVEPEDICKYKITNPRVIKLLMQAGEKKKNEKGA